MRVETTNGLIYDSTDERCELYIQPINHIVKVGFVQCYDAKTGMKKKYCGLYGVNVNGRVNFISDEQSIEGIMDSGRSYDRLTDFLKEL